MNDGQTGKEHVAGQNDKLMKRRTNRFMEGHEDGEKNKEVKDMHKKLKKAR